MKVINFFGGPGAGKSTAAAGLFYVMKARGFSVELVTEYYKELVWENVHQTSTDYLYILANQNRRLERLRNNVEYAITDSPLLLSGYYGMYYGKHSEIIVPLSYDIFDTYDNINFFINRDSRYKEDGRVHTLKEAVNIDKELKAMLRYEYTVIENDQDMVECLKAIYTIINKRDIE